MNPFDRIVTVPFSAPTAWATYRFEIGDVVEFIGQMDEDKPGLVLIVTDRDVGIWVNARDLKANSVWRSEAKQIQPPLSPILATDGLLNPAIA